MLKKIGEFIKPKVNKEKGKHDAMQNVLIRVKKAKKEVVERSCNEWMKEPLCKHSYEKKKEACSISHTRDSYYRMSDAQRL